jgi:hypothetical protein
VKKRQSDLVGGSRSKKEFVMESRREFLRHATVTLLLVPLGAAACSGDNNNNSASAVTGTSDAGGCDGIGATSTVVGGHAHTVCVSAASLSNPPVGGMTFTTSVSQSHQHTITLSQAQLRILAAGGDVMVETSIVLSHSHEFMLVKVGGTGTIVGDGGLRDSGRGTVSGSSGGTGSSGGGTGGTTSGGRGY